MGELRKIEGTFSAKDGTNLYYRVEGSGPPIVFCYGLMCRIEHWHYQTEYLKKNYQVICWDYRGHQRSESPKNEQNMGVKWCASDLVELVSHLGLERFSILSHSLGVPIAIEAAAILPPAAMVLVCGSIRNPFQNMFHSNRMEQVFQLFSLSYQWSPMVTEAIWRQLTSPKLSYLLVRAFGFNVKLSDSSDVWGYVHGVQQGSVHNFYRFLLDYTQYEGKETLSKIECPVLVLAGEEDLITPLEAQEEIASQLPKGILRVVPSGSHNAHTDHPEKVNKWITEFFSEIGF